MQVSFLRHQEIQRLKYPDEISPELFEEFAAKSEPVIIEGPVHTVSLGCRCRIRSRGIDHEVKGLIADWPAFADAERNWQKSRWDDLLRDEARMISDDQTAVYLPTEKSRSWMWVSIRQIAG